MFFERYLPIPYIDGSPDAITEIFLSKLFCIYCRISFKFVDNAPCSGLVTYFDGRAYLLFKACGKVSEADLKTLFNRANQKLKLEETLKKQSRAQLY